jgi:recombination protein RecA
VVIETIAPATEQEKDRAIELAVKDIEKEYGPGSITKMDKRPERMPCIPTGIYDLDYDVIGVGGLPRGRIIEVFGPESSGKTTVALQSVASAQRIGERAAFIDAEHALDISWAMRLGVNVNDLLVSQPDSGEQALDITARLVESKAFGIIIVDSVAALVPKAELEGSIGDSHVGLQARLMAQAMRLLASPVSKSGTVVLFINQIREKIGVTWGSPETTTGGRALKFYASVRLDVRRIGSVKDGEEIVGNRVKIKGSKNKVSAPFRECEVDLRFDRGFDIYGSILDKAVAAGVVEKSGAWYAYKGERLGQGRNRAIETVIERGLYDELLEAVLACQ